MVAYIVGITKKAYLEFLIRIVVGVVLVDPGKVELVPELAPGTLIMAI